MLDFSGWANTQSKAASWMLVLGSGVSLYMPTQFQAIAALSHILIALLNLIGEYQWPNRLLLFRGVFLVLAGSSGFVQGKIVCLLLAAAHPGAIGFICAGFTYFYAFYVSNGVQLVKSGIKS